MRPETLGDLDDAEDPRRAFPRYETRFAVRFSTVQDFVLEYAANISAGGVFVHTVEPLPLKTVVSIEMQLPGSDAPVSAKGMVVHRVTAGDAAQRGTLPGMGVQFVEARRRVPRPHRRGHRAHPPVGVAGSRSSRAPLRTIALKSPAVGRELPKTGESLWRPCI